MDEMSYTECPECGATSKIVYRIEVMPGYAVIDCPNRARKDHVGMLANLEKFSGPSNAQLATHYALKALVETEERLVKAQRELIGLLKARCLTLG